MSASHSPAAAENGRLGALRRHAILDTPEEDAFDRFTRLSADLFEAPIALLNFVGADRQWFKSEVGFGQRETDLDVSFCIYTIEEEGPMVVENAADDPRFAENPLVAGEPGVRFYAGVPLTTENGYRIGTLCVLDTEPRQVGASGRKRLETLAAMAMDQVERHRDAAELRKAKRHYQSIFEDPNILAGLVGTNGSVLDINKTALEYVDMSAEEIRGNPLWETPGLARAPDLQKRVRTLVRQAAGGEYVGFEFDLTEAIGEQTIVSGAFRPVTDEEDRVTSLLVTGRDVTERKEREKALHRARRRYRSIFEDPNTLAGLVAPDGSVLDINQTALEYVDQPLEAMRGMPFWETPWWTEAARPMIKEKVHQAAKGEYVTYEAELSRPSGAPYHVEGVIWPVTTSEGAIESMVVSARDVTERKEREEALRKSEARYRALAEHFPNGLVALFDEELRYRLVRGEQAGAEAPPAAELEGRRVQDVFDAETTDRIVPHYQAALEGESSSTEVPFRGRLYRLRTVPVSDDPPRGLVMTQDITDQEEDRRRLETLVGNLPGFVFRIRNEPGWPLVFVKGQVERVLGYTADEMEEDVGWGEEVIHPEDRDYVRRATEDGFTRTGRLDLTYRVVTKEGEERWIWERGQRVEDPVTGEEFLDGFIADVTERKEAERALRASERQIRGLASSVPGVLYRFHARSDGSWCLPYVSEKAEEVLGFDPDTDQLLEQIVSRVPDPYREQLLDSIEEAIERATLWDQEFPYVKPSGKRIWLHGRSYPEGTGEGLMFNGMLFDVTKRKEAGRELEQQKRVFQALVEHLPAGVLVESEDRTIQAANSGLCEIFDLGVSPEALAGRDCAAAAEAVKDLFAAPERFIQSIRRALAQREPRRDEFEMADGRTLARDYVPYEHSHGAANLWVYHDVTEERERERALRGAKEEAEAAARLKDAMLANMSHEVRTPLTAIIGYAEMLRADLGGPESELAEYIYRSGRRLERTLDAMLSLSKLEGGAYEPSPERVDLTRLVEEVVGELAPKARKQGVEVETQLPEAAVGRWDENALRRVLGNLLDNAIKFTPEDGRAAVRARLEDHEAVLEVEDTGIGIGEEVREKIFEPFKQESEGNTREYEGTGLGLPIVQEFVELMGGTIGLESEKSEGTRFIVRLPRQPNSPARAADFS